MRFLAALAEFGWPCWWRTVVVEQILTGFDTGQADIAVSVGLASAPYQCLPADSCPSSSGPEVFWPVAIGIACTVLAVKQGSSTVAVYTRLVLMYTGKRYIVMTKTVMTECFVQK